MIQRPLEQLRCGPKAIVQVERFTETDGELESIALIETARVHGAQRLARRGELGRVGIPPESLQMDASQHQPRAIGHRRLLQRFERGLLGLVVLSGVVEATGLGEGVGGGDRLSRQHQDRQAEQQEPHAGMVAQPRA